jgi:pimeloyl-ACP methyl ester carboxylesterase
MKQKTVASHFIRVSAVSFLIILICCLFGPFLIPIPPLENSVLPEKLADADSSFIAINDVTVHYKRAGSGKDTLILLHGFAASTFTWHRVITPLSQSYTVIAYDRTGFGYTSRPMPGEWSGDSPYGQRSQMEQLIALMDTLNIDNAILVGSSAGGITAALTAVNHPKRIKALILVAAAIFDGVPPRWLSLLMRTPHMKRLGPLLLRKYYTNFFEHTRKRAWHDSSQLTTALLEGYRKPLQAQNWDRALWEYAFAYESLHLEEQLGEIKVPVLVITGDDDRIVSPEASKHIADVIPHAQLVVIPHAGHLPHEETPEVLLKEVHAFLRQVL